MPRPFLPGFSYAKASHTNPARWPALLVAGLLTLIGTGAMAGPSDGLTGMYVQGGHNFKHGTDTDNVFVGVMVPFGGTHEFLGSEVTTYMDAFVGEWRGPDMHGQDKSHAQIAALAMGRFRFNEGRSPFFGEAGAGGSYLAGTYTKPDGRIQGSHANFALRFGVGASFGARDEQEVTLSYQHFSNAGLKKPNPGEDFLQVRYAYRF